VAETGELKPRTRRLGASDQWPGNNIESEYITHADSETSTPQVASISDKCNPFATPRTSRSSSLSLQLSSWDNTQHELATPPTSEISTPQEIISDGVDTNRGVPSPVILHDPIESYYNRLQQLREHRSTWSPNEWGPEVPQTVLTGQNHERLSQVLRKVNSQFEILRPGTLNALEERQQITKQQQDKRSHRKLRKKRLSQGSGYSIDMG
jgi:hypothetical protein